ncbi:MAG: hypothetical protein KGL68_04150 [Burkholderiales bacterium]|nr:hypothetical protein [Burkholderiales bacterium]
MPHIEKRRNLWYATLKVPPKLQEKVGKAKFLQSLGTPDKRRAEALAAPVVALWKAQLRKAEGQTDAVLEEALEWKRNKAHQTHEAMSAKLAATGLQSGVDPTTGEVMVKTASGPWVALSKLAAR